LPGRDAIERCWAWLFLLSRRSDNATDRDLIPFAPTLSRGRPVKVHISDNPWDFASHVAHGCLHSLDANVPSIVKVPSASPSHSLGNRSQFSRITTFGVSALVTKLRGEDGAG
jgi:hypothetical protein